jgi:hypothetical protein
MAYAPELQSIVEAAAQAANAGDFVSAERLLREVASRQETELGPTHPDLANTLNNLGVVCEGAGRPFDAEGYYRRAYAIAASTLASDDPLFVTSRNNLHDFCEARGRPFEPEALPAAAPLPLEPEPPPAAPLRKSEPEASRTASPLHERELEAVTTASSLRKSKSGGSRDRLVAVALIAFALVLLVWYGPWRDSPEPSVGADTSSSAPPAPAPPPTEDAGPPSADVPSTPSALRTTARAPSPVPVEPTPARTASAPAAIAVVEARLCRSLSRSDWRCEPAEREDAPGPFYFYTRLASGRDATVRHQWYYEGRLQQNVTLQVGANARAGYRTYSRQTVAAGRAGNWRVELLGADGALLHEERFTVR